MEKDEGVRGPYAAAFSLVLGNEFRVFLDLLKRSSANDHRRTWDHDLFVTIAVLEREKILQSEFSPDELQRIGQLVVAELAVLYRLQTEHEPDDERGPQE